MPAGLEEKLGDLAAEVRKLRVLRGVSAFTAVVFVLPVAAVCLDVAFQLSAAARGLMLGVWVSAAALAFWLLVARRMRGDVPQEALASAIERQYPNLAERVRTLVELSEHADSGNGSRGMITLLGKETEKRTRKMNFLSAAPTGFSLRLAAVAALVGGFALLPLFLFNGAGDRVRRLVLPWYAPPADVPFVVKVSSGSPVVRRGEPVTLAAYLERTKPGEPLPTAAVVVCRAKDDPTTEKRLPMTGDDKAAFTVTRPNVLADFEYQVECGPARSDWFAVSAVDPVEVADGSSITVTPPDYAKKTVAETKRDGLGEIEALQHSDAAFEVRLSRPPSDAHLEFRPGDPKADQTPVNMNGRLRFSNDRRAVSAVVPLTSDGTVKLTLFGDKGVRTEVPVAVRAVPDAAPRFEKVVGMPGEMREVSPDMTLTFELAVTDDVAVGPLVVDFAAADSPPDRFQSEPLALPQGEKRAEGTAKFALAGKVKLGDAVRIRLRARDGRSIPALGLSPNETTFPDKGWAELKVVANARPLREQDIAGQKDKVRQQLDAITKKVNDSAEEVADLAKLVKGEPKLSDVEAAQVDVNRNRVRVAADLLNDLAKAADVEPELRPLATAARDLAADQLAAAEDSLRKAKTEPNREPRDEALGDAKKALTAAAAKLKALQKANEDGANARLDRAKLEQLADEQKKLADAAATADPAAAKDLAAKQKELTERLEKLADESDLLKKARKKAEQERTNQLVEDLQNLADRQRELDEAVAKSADAARREQLDGLNSLQKQLNEKADRTRGRTDAAARQNGAKPLDKQPFDQAADRLDRKAPADAMSAQEQAARDLDRLADSLADAVKARGDAKAAAGQIARWQKDLNQRSADAARQNPGGIPKAERDKLTAEQRAIQKATDRLALPESPELERLRTTVAEKTAAAAEKLEKNQPGTELAQKKAADALTDLAERTPSNKERHAAAKSELEKLRREQDRLQKEADEAARGVRLNPDDKQARDELAKKLADAATAQDELAKKVKRLDTPGLEDRRDRTAAAGERAADDMRAGLPQDVPSSQGELKRRLDRLRDALDGKTPADDKANELARLQNELTKNLTQTKKPEELQRLQRQQQDLAEQLAKMSAPEAAQALADAQAAARNAAKPDPDVDELRKKSKDASAALNKLADRLNGDEAAEKRLERLARNRQAEADKAKDAEVMRADQARAREAQKQAKNDAGELADTRTGNAQAAKKKLQEALDKLAKADEPDRAKDLQQQAADAARRLSEAVRKNGDRKGEEATDARPSPDPADANDPANALPTAADVESVRDLAKQQRQLRDDVAKAMERAAKGPPQPPSDRDPLGDLAKEQQELAKEAGELCRECQGGAAGQPSADAAKAAQQAADELAGGDPADAKKAAAEAAQKLRDTAKSAAADDVKKKAEGLAQKQEQLSQRAEQASADPSAAVNRQRNRQPELADRAKQLADRLNEAAKSADPKAAKTLDAAADGTKKAAGEMDQADRHAKNGKPADAGAARRQAERSLEEAARAAKQGGKPADEAGDPQPGDANAQAANDAVKQAAQQQAQAQGQMGKGNGQDAAKPAQQAADKLKEAADQMAKAGQPDGQPGQGGTDPGQGGKGGAADMPNVVLENLGKSWGELPGEVKTKVMAELKAKYGDEYARVIKLYFEQLADRK
jgi:hypothetical protein